MAEITIGQLGSFYKNTYSKELAKLVPEFAKLYKLASKNKSRAQLVGKQWILPVQVSSEAALSAQASGTPFSSTTSPIPMKVLDATVNPFQMSLRSALDVEAIQRSNTAEQAYDSVISFLFTDMKVELTRQMEWTHMMGGQPVASIDGAPGTDGSNKVLTLTGHAPSFIASLLNHNLDAYNGASKVNTNAPLSVVKVAPGANQITVSGNSTDLAALADTYNLWRTGFKAVENPGLVTAISNTGTLWGIDAATNGLWGGNVVEDTGVISITKVADAVALCQSMGADTGNLICFASPRNFGKLISQANQLVRYDNGSASMVGRQAKQGFTGIDFTLDGVTFSIERYNYLPDDKVVIVPDDKLDLVKTSADVIFGTKLGELMFFDGNTNTYQVTGYLSQALVLTHPAQAAILTGVTQS